MEASTFSASFGLSQKWGSTVISCSFCRASSFLSMSKMPPQGSCSIPQILDLFFSHVANIVLMCKFQMCEYADACHLKCRGEVGLKCQRGCKISFTAPLNSFL